MRYLNILFFCLLVQFTNAQSKMISGKVIDSITKGNVSNGVVTLVKVQDSALVDFTRVKADGSFSMAKPNNGAYYLYVSHPRFADFVDSITIDDAKFDLGTIYVTTKRRMLEQVIVKAQVSPIKIKGDTIIYTADSFKVKEGANVEDLLKKLPGIQVGRNGEIKAMGETVKKVLVDGEEFFGSDPGVVTKNLQANAIDKVEVFDKKSDQAAFTGIDDGVKDKTINLKLKDNKKKGYFGKLEATGGTPDNYDAQAMINAFQNKRKLAAFGMLGNIGNTSLGWDDNQSYGGGDGIEMGTGEFGGMWMSSQGDDFSNFWGGSNGIPKNWNGGMHYSNKFNKDKQNLNFGYKYNKVNSIAENKTFSTTFLPDSTWNDNSGSTAFSSKNRNKVNFSLETKLDSFNIIKFTINAHEQNTIGTNNSFSESFSDVNPINASTRKVTNDAKSKNLAVTALWMHKFKKLNRTLSLNLSNTYTQNNSDGFLLSYNSFYKNGVLLKRDTVNQEKINTSENRNFSTRLSYTEPLTKKITAELSYALNYNGNDNNRTSLDRDASGKYTIVAPQFSNNFAFRTTVHTPSVSFKYDHKKIKASIGTKLGFNHFDQKDITNNRVSLYNFTNVFPSASFGVKLKGNSGINLNYNGSGVAPKLDQLQPIQDNNNPFAIVIGNPDLKQSFTHNFFGNYNMWNVIKNKNIWSNFGIRTQQNAYTSFTTIDTLGRRITKTVNVNGNYSANFSFNYGFKIKSIGLGLYIGPSLSTSKGINFVNGLKNISRTSSYGFSMNADKWVEDKDGNNKFGFWMQHSFTQNNNKASINQTSAANFRMLSGNVSIDVAITKKLHLNNEVEYEVRQKDPRFAQNNNFALWNIALQQVIIKGSFTMEFKVRDLLNQNRGFNRSFNSYNYTESFYNTLRRFWTLTATYKFNSQKLKKKTDAK
jgi:Outer membrane protein beta-barrel family